MLRILGFFILVAGATAEDITRIINGTDAQKGMFPHQVSLQTDFGHSCGGSIIADRWVLTAGHCLIGIPYTVVAGSLTWIGSDPEAQKRTAINSYRHPDYALVAELGGAYMDYAVLEMDAPFVFGDTVMPITIATQGEELPAGECIASGWGRTDQNTNELPDILQYIDTQALDTETCQAVWSIYYPEGTLIEEQHLCIYREGTGSCNGDSGGPLICKDSAEEWKLYGVVSFGVGADSPTFPEIDCRTDAPSIFAQANYEANVEWVNTTCGGCLA